MVLTIDRQIREPCPWQETAILNLGFSVAEQALFAVRYPLVSCRGGIWRAGTGNERPTVGRHQSALETRPPSGHQESSLFMVLLY